MYSYYDLKMLKDNGIESIPTDISHIEEYQTWFDYEEFIKKYKEVKDEFKFTWIALCICCSEIVKTDRIIPFQTYAQYFGIGENNLYFVVANYLKEFDDISIKDSLKITKIIIDINSFNEPIDIKIDKDNEQMISMLMVVLNEKECLELLSAANPYMQPSPFTGNPIFGYDPSQTK